MLLRVLHVTAQLPTMRYHGARQVRRAARPKREDCGGNFGGN